MNQRNERGQSIIEYLILIVVLAIGSVAVIKSIGSRMSSRLNEVDRTIRDLEKGRN